MAPGKPGSTAIGAAVMRALHRAFDAPPRILDDPHALSLAGLPGEAVLPAAQVRLEADFLQHADPQTAARIARYLRAAVLLRNRYAEDELAQAIGRGVRQYVLLGAGLDSFAWRRPDLAASIEIFELDLAATQDWKRQRLQAGGLAVPPNLHLVPIDFERQQPLQALAASRFRADQPAFFSWLGVTSYLTEIAILATLRNVAGAAPGSTIVFSYGLAQSGLGPEGRRVTEVLRAVIAARGEPAASAGFLPHELAGKLASLGYSEVEDLGVEAAQARYFDGRDDDLQAAPITHHMKAVVGAHRAAAGIIGPRD